MNLAPINLTEIIAVMMGCSVVLIPVLGLTLRFALKPLVDSLRAGRNEPQQVQQLQARIERLESQLRALQAATS